MVSADLDTECQEQASLRSCAGSGGSVHLGCVPLFSDVPVQVGESRGLCLSSRRVLHVVCMTVPRRAR
eukprot:2698259-Alexandrium_andersonii.AAC.1